MPRTQTNVEIPADSVRVELRDVAAEVQGDTVVLHIPTDIQLLAITTNLQSGLRVSGFSPSQISEVQTTIARMSLVNWLSERMDG